MTSEEIRLYDGVAPGSEGWSQVESRVDTADNVLVRNVVTPTLTHVAPGEPNGAAIVIAPGGGFRMLSWEQEGTQLADWLAARGYDAYVLKYRLLDTGPTVEDFTRALGEMTTAIMESDPLRLAEIAGPVGPLAYADGAAAMRLVRGRTAGPVALLGFSAGAFVASHVALCGDDTERPDALACIYGGTVHAPVSASTPPAFFAVAQDDFTHQQVLALDAAWRAAGRPAELHAYDQGGHGFGMRTQGLPVDDWVNQFGAWLTSVV